MDKVGVNKPEDILSDVHKHTQKKNSKVTDSPERYSEIRQTTKKRLLIKLVN